MAYNGRRLTKIRKEKSIYVNEYEKETRPRRGGGGVRGALGGASAAARAGGVLFAVGGYG